MSDGVRRLLVTGGVRSGKSRHAEARFAADAPVHYVTPGYPAGPDDTEWADRVALHQARRPPSWVTIETVDIAGAIEQADAPVLVDCLGVWVTRTFDAWDAWDRPRSSWQERFDAEVERLVGVVSAFGHQLVVVTNEVGWGVVPPYPAGRLFADCLGHVNASIAGVMDGIVLMVAGRPLVLPASSGR